MSRMILRLLLLLPSAKFSAAERPSFPQNLTFTPYHSIGILKIVEQFRRWVGATLPTRAGPAATPAAVPARHARYLMPKEQYRPTGVGCENPA